MKKSIKLVFTIVFAFILLTLTKEKSLATDTQIISENCFLFPIANTDEEMLIEYEKSTSDNKRIYNQGPIAPKLMTGEYENWIEQRKAGCDYKENHNGIDITAKDPSKVLTNTYDLIAIADGTVVATSAGRYSYAGISFPDSHIRTQTQYCDGGGYGNYIILKLDNYRAIINGAKYYVYALYGHMYKDTITLKPGDKVSAGDVLGKMGSSGDSGHPHLHFEIFSTNSYKSLEAQIGGARANIPERLYSGADPVKCIQPQVLNNVELSEVKVRKDNDTTITFEANYNGLVTVNEAPTLEVYIGDNSEVKYYPEYIESITNTDNTTKLIYTMTINDTYDGELKFSNITDGDVTNAFDSSKQIKENQVTNFTGETIVFQKKQYEKGDINKDGVINADDLMLVKKFCLKIIDFTEEEIELADVTGDGEVMSNDLLKIKKYVLKLIDSLDD